MPSITKMYGTMNIKYSYSIYKMDPFIMRDGVAQLVQRLATGLDSPGIECRWRRDFPQPTLGPTQPPIQWFRVFPGAN